MIRTRAAARSAVEPGPTYASHILRSPAIRGSRLHHWGVFCATACSHPWQHAFTLVVQIISLCPCALRESTLTILACDSYPMLNQKRVRAVWRGASCALVETAWLLEIEGRRCLPVDPSLVGCVDTEHCAAARYSLSARLAGRICCDLRASPL